MLDLKVAGMTCGHCEQAVARAVKSVDPQAKVSVDRTSGHVAVESASDAKAIRAAIEDFEFEVALKALNAAQEEEVQ